MAVPVFLALVEAAALALWALARWPERSPRNAIALGLTFVASIALLQLTPDLARLLTSLGGAPTALTLGVLPAFTFLFWATGCLIRMVVETAGSRFRLR